MSFTMMPNVFRSRVQLLISDSSSVSSPPPQISFFVHVFYLFKAEIYGLYQAWKGKQMLQLTKTQKKSQAFILQQYICLF